MALHSNILAWRIPWTEEPGGLVHGVTESWTQLSTHSHIVPFVLAVLTWKTIFCAKCLKKKKKRRTWRDGKEFGTFWTPIITFSHSTKGTDTEGRRMGTYM